MKIRSWEKGNPYTGESIEPTVKDGDRDLTEDTDYEVTYGENTKAS